MFEGESGIISVLTRYGIYSDADYNRSRSAYILPNGSRIKGFSAEKPDRLRGRQHHGGWCDELAAWQYPEAWDQYLFGLRKGKNPQTIVTTTPRPTPLIKSLTKDPDTIIVRGTTYENSANLAESALITLQTKYGDTRSGRQSYTVKSLTITPALWNRGLLESARVKEAPNLLRAVVWS
jgi:phage terminase large subunit-like protein